MSALRGVLSACLLLLVVVSVPGQVGPQDALHLNMVSITDPNYPEPEIGQRFMSMQFNPDPAWVEHEAWLVLARSQQGAEFDPFQPFGWPVEGPQAERYVVKVTPMNPTPPLRVDHIVRHRRHGQNANTRGDGATGYDFFKDGDPVFYRWIIRHRAQPSDPWTVLGGDTHSFTMPRRLVVAILGDSFGSGEGAPSLTGDPWAGGGPEPHRGRRSKESGQNLAVTLFGSPQEIAFDAINLSSSGAIAEDIYSFRGQFYRPDEKPHEPGRNGVTYSQIQQLRLEMAQRGYHTIDAVILSAGGNDLGFANIVTYYFGVTLAEIYGYAIASLASAGILDGLANLFSGLQDHSIYSDYPGGYPANYRMIRFPWMQNRLLGEMAKVAQELDRVPAGQPSWRWKVNKVGVTEYPNPLEGTTQFMESVPLPQLAGKLTSHSSGFFSYTVKLTEAEAKEINDILIPPLSLPRPPGGGFNHGLLQAIQYADTFAPNTAWSLIETRSYQGPRTGIGFSDRHFNTLRDAAFLDRGEPEKRKNHAIHPNDKGHRNIYRWAIFDYLWNELDESYRRAQAVNLFPPTVIQADLLGSVRVVSYDATNRLLEVDLYVENRGGAGAPATQVLLSFAEPIGHLGSAAIPALAGGASHQASVVLSIPTNSFFDLHRFYCKDSLLAYPGFELYADRDVTLAHFFPRRWRVTAHIDPNEAIAESTKANNRFTSPNAVEIPPTVASSTINNVLIDLELNIPDYGGSPLVFEQLLRSDILSFFGYYSTFVRIFVEDQIPQGNEMETLANSLLVPAFLEAGLPAPTNSEFQVNSGLRPICLFPDRDLILVASDKVTRGRRAVYDGPDLTELAPRDGRSFDIEARIPSLDGLSTNVYDTLLDPVVERAGLPWAADGELAAGLNLEWPIQVPPGLQSVRFYGGLQPGSADRFDTGHQNPAEIGASLIPAGVPQDGRDFYLTVESFINESIEREHYWFTTPTLHAPLRQPPLEGGVLPTQRFAWGEPDSPADGYRLFVGSYPGGADLFPGEPLTHEKLNEATVPAGTQEMEIEGLPRDGRPVFVSLFTFTGSEWREERYRTFAAQAENGSIAFPPAGSRLGGFNQFELAAGGEGVLFHRLRLGLEPGGDDLFDSGLLPPENIEPVQVPLPASWPGMIFATMSTYRDPGMEEEQEVIPFFRAIEATPLAPPPGTPIPPQPTLFTWQPAQEASAYRLRVFADNDDMPIYDETFGNGILDATVDLTPFPGAAVRFELSTLGPGGWSSVQVPYFIEYAPGYDYESDDLPASWQFFHFGPNNPLAHPDADPDGDGCSNLFEYLGGTDPNDPDDCLRPQWQLVNGLSRYVFPAVYPNTGYRQEGSTNLVGWASSGELIPDTYTTNAILDRPLMEDAGNELFRFRLIDRRPKSE